MSILWVSFIKIRFFHNVGILGQSITLFKQLTLSNRTYLLILVQDLNLHMYGFGFIFRHLWFSPKDVTKIIQNIQVKPIPYNNFHSLLYFFSFPELKNFVKIYINISYEKRGTAWVTVWCNNHPVKNVLFWFESEKYCCLVTDKRFSVSNDKGLYWNILIFCFV